jgi:nitrite reductase (NADH) large subunit
MVLDDAEVRRALWERLQFALDGEPDPWHEPERANVDVRQFVPLVPVDARELAAAGVAASIA